MIGPAWGDETDTRQKVSLWVMVMQPSLSVVNIQRLLWVPGQRHHWARTPHHTTTCLPTLLGTENSSIKPQGNHCADPPSHR